VPHRQPSGSTKARCWTGRSARPLHTQNLVKSKSGGGDFTVVSNYSRQISPQDTFRETAQLPPTARASLSPVLARPPAHRDRVRARCAGPALQRGRQTAPSLFACTQPSPARTHPGETRHRPRHNPEASRTKLSSPSPPALLAATSPTLSHSEEHNRSDPTPAAGGCGARQHSTPQRGSSLALSRTHTLWRLSRSIPRTRRHSSGGRSHRRQSPPAAAAPLEPPTWRSRRPLSEERSQKKRPPPTHHTIRRLARGLRAPPPRSPHGV
jgi:hypothetical protein